jgi:hypothetical protein
MIGRLLCWLGYHRYRFWHFGEVGDGPCERCGKWDLAGRENP